MALPSSLRTLLLAQSAITAIAAPRTIGQTANVPGVFVERAMQGFRPPYIVITEIDHDPMKHLGSTTGMASSDIDIDCYGDTWPTADSLADAVADFLKDYSGAASTDTINAVLWEGRQREALEPGDGSDTWRYLVSLSFTMQHTEA